MKLEEKEVNPKKIMTIKRQRLKIKGIRRNEISEEKKILKVMRVDRIKTEWNKDKIETE